MHLINFDALKPNKSIKVGRSVDAQLRITDISVSRHHSNLTLNSDGSISLSDNNSRLGTLLLLRNPLPIDKKEATYIQVGNTTLCIDAAESFSFWDKMDRCLGW